MLMRHTIRIFLGAVTLFGFFACSQPAVTEEKAAVPASNSDAGVSVPDFNSDSAYDFIRQQVAFGPRVPNTKAHRQCSDYLHQKLAAYSTDVVEQKATVTAFDGTKLEIVNHIARFNPEQKGRVLLFAHWDCRPWADQDSVRTREPVDGADDGASGVGILLEMARQFSIKQPAIGVDIAFFDAEDWGAKGGGQEAEDSYALGTQYWTAHPHVSGYSANYGILLDMAGGRGARFRMEGYSKEYAGPILEKIWRHAAALGYSDYFIFEDGGYVTDDHVYVIKYGIPSVDIIHSDKTTRSGFASHWHTHADTLDVIDRATLKAVGQTLLQTVYREGY